MTGAWWCSWSSKPVRGANASRVGSIPIRLRHFLKIMAENNKTTTRLFITILLLAAGAVLLSAGMFRAVEVQNLPQKDTAKAQTTYQPILHLSESTVILDITLGGLVRLDSGDIQRTYGGDIKPAARCPT